LISRFAIGIYHIKPLPLRVILRHPFFKCLRWVHLCSLDAALAGFVWQELFASTFKVPLAPIHRVILPLSIYLAYTADRLWDARKFDPDHPSTERLHFHHRYCKSILSIWIIGFATSLLLAHSFLSARTIVAGLLLILIIQCYYLLSRIAHRNGFLRIGKDAATACLFSCGCSFFVLMQRPDETGTTQLILLQLGLALLCLLNLHTIGFMEKQLNLAQSEKPSRLQSHPLLNYCFLLIITWGYSLLFLHERHPLFATAILAASLLQTILLLLANNKQPHPGLRYLADWPLIIVIILPCLAA